MSPYAPEPQKRGGGNGVRGGGRWCACHLLMSLDADGGGSAGFSCHAHAVLEVH
eukprot:COSAG01_NODE_42473_length_439_cov_9.170588_2_plen_53_part_01